MQPLFQAVAHGCFCGQTQDVMENIVWDRIKRGQEHYLMQKLCAFSDDLALLSHFFESNWLIPSSNLSDYRKACVLNWAGYDLRFLGRLRESVAPMELSYFALKEQSDLKHASRAACNLSEVQIPIGEINAAIQNAKKSLEFAEKSQDLFERLISSIALADALHQSGKFEDALELFQKANTLQSDWNLFNESLYPPRDFQYGELLLGLNKFGDFRKDTLLALRIAHKNSWGLNIALDQLLLGKYYLKIQRIYKAEQWTSKSIESFRNASTLDHLPYGLLEQAKLQRLKQKYYNSLVQLKEVFDISASNDMRLHLTDYHLEMARLILAIEADPTQYPEATPDREQRTLPPEIADPDEPGILTLEGHIQAADKLIQDTGYHRRDAELAELKQQAGMPC